MSNLTDRAVGLFARLPRKGEEVDLDSLGVSSETLPDWIREQIQIPSSEELLDDFLEQATDSPEL